MMWENLMLLFDQQWVLGSQTACWPVEKQAETLTVTERCEYIHVVLCNAIKGGKFSIPTRVKLIIAPLVSGKQTVTTEDNYFNV